MLGYYKLNERRLMQIEQPEKGCMIYAVAPEAEEIEAVVNTAGIEEDLIRAALDEEERGRIERDGKNTLIIVDMPVLVRDSADSVTYSTLPAGIILAEEYFVAVSLSADTVIKDLVAERSSVDIPQIGGMLFLKIMQKCAEKYLSYLRQIEKITDYIERRLHKATRNAELMQLLDLQKSLIYMSTSLKNIGVTLQRIERGRVFALDEEANELLDDVIIEFRQAQEMAEIFSSVLGSTIGTMSTVISNNLNVIMKILTSLTILMSISTVISGFWGMNVSDIPLSESFWFPVGLSFIVTLVVFIILVRKKML